MRVLLVFSVLLASVQPVFAQGWPNRAVTLVVGFAAGGGTDVLARIVVRKLSEVLGQQVVDRECRRRRRHGRLGACREGAARRLHHRDVHPRRCHQPDALQEAALQSPDRPCAGGADRRPAGRADRPQRLSGQHPAGVHRPCEKEPGDAAVRLGRRGLDRPSSTASCSTPPSASTSPTCRTAAAGRRCRTSSAVVSTTSAR